MKAGLEDVSAPFEPLTGKQDETDCTTEGPDGFVDLTLKYKTQDVKSIVGVAEDGDVVVISITGELTDGTPIMGEDVIRVIDK